MSSKLLKVNGTKYIPKSPKVSKNNQKYSNNEIKEYSNILSQPFLNDKIRKPFKKYEFNNHKLKKNFEKATNRHSASQICSSLLPQQYYLEKIEEEKNMDEFIKDKNNFCKVFNRSTFTQYKPLSFESKFESYHDMEKLSFERFKKYNSIFEKIKEQIYDIDQVYKSIININHKNKENDKNEFIIGKKTGPDGNKKIFDKNNNTSSAQNKINKEKIILLKKSSSVRQFRESDLYRPKMNNSNNLIFTMNTNDNGEINESESNISIQRNCSDKEKEKNNQVKNSLERRRIENIALIHKRNELKKTLSRTNRRNLKISNGTNFYYEGESNCRCEKCTIF